MTEHFGPRPDQPTSETNELPLVDQEAEHGSIAVPKSPELLQAQVAAFAAEGLSKPADQRALMDQVVSVAATNPDE